MFLALGHLTITCSTPPDVILSFCLSESRPEEEGQSRRSSGTKVRISFSRLARELCVDFEASKSELSEQMVSERHRSKRIVPLASTSDPSLEHTSGERVIQHRFPGLGICRTEGWHREEVEGLRRLWVLREEWVRYL